MIIFYCNDSKSLYLVKRVSATRTTWLVSSSFISLYNTESTSNHNVIFWLDNIICVCSTHKNMLITKGIIIIGMEFLIG